MKHIFFICLRRKKQVTIYFLFSVQLFAAVYPFMSNHQYLYPPIPMPSSYNKAVCYMTGLKPYLASQYEFMLISRCTHALQSSLSSCICCIHPSFTLSLSVYSSPLFLSPSLGLTYQEASDVCWCPFLFTFPTCLCFLYNCFAHLPNIPLPFHRVFLCFL